MDSTGGKGKKKGGKGRKSGREELRKENRMYIESKDLYFIATLITL